jgi:gliding motility-associated-like protein
MMKKVLPFFLCFVIVACGKISNAQMIFTGGYGNQIFFPGHFLEISQAPNGSFGTQSPPTGPTTPPIYNPHGSNLAEVYDYGHDGWTVGTPPEYGDYTYPGSPFEGWAIQTDPTPSLATAYYSVWPYGVTYSGTAGLAGGNVAYTNSGGTMTGDWVGNYGGLVIKQQTRLDTNASWVVVTTKFYNTTASNICNIYYLRSCDPDNDETWPGGSFMTNNYIDYKNDVDHRAEVTAYGTYYTNCSIGLCTKDPRAKAFIYDSWPLGAWAGVDLSTVWNETYGTADYAVHTWSDGDIAIGLIYNICCINAGDSDFVSYAYVFNGPTGVDSAFPDPTLVVNGTMVTPPAAPAAVYDTFNVCAYPGMTTVPVSLAYATTGVWTWSTWSWAPSTGLSSTTGSSVLIDATAIPGNITYTITGTWPNNGTCYDSVHRVMYLTIHTCNTIWATANTPCAGDSLKLVCHPDTTASLYYWSGPAGFTATSQKPFIYPSTMANAGTYTVVRTIISSGFVDTANVTVTIHPLPTVTASSNSPLCAGAVDTLFLVASPVSPGETFSWTGPNSFTSTSPTPVRDSFVIPDTGYYTVNTMNTFGCVSSATTHVILLPPPVAPVITDPNYCTGDPFVNFTLGSITGVVHWFTDSVGGTASLFAPVVNTSIPGNYTFWASQVVGTGSSSCESPRSSVTVHVVQTPPAPVVPSSITLCEDSTLYLSATDTASGVVYHWSHALDAFATTVQNPIRYNVQDSATGNYLVYVTEVIAIPGSTSITCTSPSADVYVTVKETPPPPTVTATSPCDSGELDLTAFSLPGCTYHWNFPNGDSSVLQNPVLLGVIGQTTGIYTVTSMLNGCGSLPATELVVVHPNPLPPTGFDTTYCQYDASVPMRAVPDTLSDVLVWINYNNGQWSGAPLPPPVTSIVDTQYWYVMDTTVYGCRSKNVLVKATILYKPNFNIGTSADFACQDSFITLNYVGTAMTNPGYMWTLPWGTTVLEGSLTSPSIKVQFDSLYNNWVYLTATDFGGRCSTQDTIKVKVEEMPTCNLYINPVICLGDTVDIALTQRGASAYNFIWTFDNANIVFANSNSGGPYSVSWDNSGTRDVTVTPFTVDGCRGKVMHDTVVVRQVPDSKFYASNNTRGDNVLCQEDSVLFVADMGDSANFMYSWAPKHFFTQNGKAVVWGRVGISGDITLTVTDPFNCVSATSENFSTETCCNIFFPNAFTPNGDGLNDKFHPIFTGYHRFHTFRIQNRWGQTVFESDDNSTEWDGNFGGVPQDMGVYFYYIKYDCGSSVIEKRGDITLVR